MIHDVAVVGAGPAGCAAAVTLARAGMRPVVVDRAHFPRHKACGDGLTAGALRLLEQLGLDPGSVEAWQRVDEACIRSPSGRTVRFELPRGGQFAAVVPRLHLDAALVQLVRREGVELLEGVACRDATEHSDRVTLQMEGRDPLEARYVVAADGMWSPVRKHLSLGLDGYRGDWHAFRQYFAGVEPQAAGALWVWFEPELLPGYAWSFPLPDGRANVGFGIRRGGKVPVGDMGQLWGDLLERPHIRAVLGEDATPVERHRAWPIPAGIRRLPLTGNRTMFVGDAAAATDPMTGEGIAQALLTGIGAAEAVAAAGPDDAEQAMARYRRFVRAELLADHGMARRCGRVLASVAGARAAVRIAGLTGWTRRNFARWMFEDYPRSLITTPRRWSRGALTRPGAYSTPRP